MTNSELAPATGGSQTRASRENFEKPLTVEQVMELLSLKKRDQVYRLLAMKLADGQTLGVKVQEKSRC